MGQPTSSKVDESKTASDESTRELSFRQERKRPGFTMIYNDAVRDQRISMRAKGLLVFLYSQPETFALNIVRLAQWMSEGEPAYQGSEGDADLREGRDALRSAMRELKAAGYVRQERLRNARGHWDWIFTVTDEPLIGAQMELISPVDNSQSIDGSSVYGLTRENMPNVQVAPETGEPSTDEPSLLEEQIKEYEYPPYPPMDLSEPSRTSTAGGDPPPPPQDLENHPAISTRRAGVSPRQLGTNPRGLDVDIQRPEIRPWQSQFERNKAREEGRGCPDCEGDGMIEVNNATMQQCSTCRGEGIARLKLVNTG